MRRLIDEWLAPFRWPGTYLLWIALSLVAALVGPFGTFVLLGLPQRLLFWMLALALTLVAGALVRAIVRRLPGLGQTGWAGPVVAGVLALLLTPVYTFLIGGIAHAGTLNLVPAEVGASLFFSTLAIIAMLRRPGSGDARPDPPPDSPPAPPPAAALEPGAPPDPPAPADLAAARLLRRLEPELRGRLVSISVRDHYVDVVTDRGRASLLMRLSDAMAEAEGEEGAQVHRSHWVARHAARAIDRRGGRLMLVLADGTSLPVSRNQRPQIDGWTLPDLADPQPPDAAT